jgi:putative endonuclease
MTYSVFDKPLSHRAIGDGGEVLAVDYFTKRGFEIVEQNVQYRFGEIDLIIRRGLTLHFVEVKYRRSLTYGRPEEAVTYRKLKRVRLAVMRYLQDRGLQARDIQIDVLAILALPAKEIEYTWISPAV